MVSKRKHKKNPLRRRLLRELRSEIGKYLVILLLLIGSIGFTSGFLVADGSMLATYNDGFTTYNVEDGNFRTADELNQAQKKIIGEMGVELYDNTYVEEKLDNGTTLRIFNDRSEVNLVCLMEGRMPQQDGEIAIDRMYADNNRLKVGDSLIGEDGSWTITGLVALPDYSCLFSDNNDAMFDASLFGVAVLTRDGLEQLDSRLYCWSYSWKYKTAPADDQEESALAEEFMKELNSEVSLETFIPQYLNQAIHFTGDDMGSDRAMIVMLLYMVILILAFVFAITISNTIVKEATVIGTLRASGYTRRELIRHYMAMPVLVTAVGAVIGNILGYTVFKGVCVGMYYGSYSLPTYVTIWSAEAFWKTTLIPVLMMGIVNYTVLRSRLFLSPLRFLRGDLRRGGRKRAFPLSVKIPFFRRFRMRVMLQNLSSYGIMFFGILLANLLLMFGLMMGPWLDHYQAEIENNCIARYQYMFSIPVSAMNEDKKLESMLALLQYYRGVETENEDAEKFSAYSLNTVGTTVSEKITLYGVEPDSSYVEIDGADGAVYISSAYSDKYQLGIGDTVTLKEPYGDETYEFVIAGTYHYEGALALFMDRETLNETFDLDRDYFGGYFSDSEITDIDETYVGSVIDVDTLTKISRQLDISMGSMMIMIDAFSVIMFVILMYLLTKLIIEKNAQSISMVKILGYSNREISRLYLMSTTVVVTACVLISLPIEAALMTVVFRVMMMNMSGWISLYLEPAGYVKMALLGIGTYLFVALLEYRRIKRVPMDEALKHVE